MPYSRYHTNVKKTTIYLENDEAEGLRRLASQTGKSQAELVREIVRGLLAPGPRAFHSMASGRSSRGRTPDWEPEALYKRVMGED